LKVGHDKFPSTTQELTGFLDEDYDNEEVPDREAIKRQAAHIVHNKNKNKILRRFRRRKG
jgi:hypothetical protein